MRPAHRRPKGALAPFGLAPLLLALSAPAIGHQDLAASIARQPGVGDRGRAHLVASPFGTIHAATFRFPRPVGTAIPAPFGLVRSNVSLDIDGRGRRAFDPPAEYDPERTFPIVDRARKGDRIVAARKEKAIAPAAEPPDAEPAAAESPAAEPPAAADMQLAMLPPAVAPDISAVPPMSPVPSDLPANAEEPERPRTPFSDWDTGELAPFEPDGAIAAPEHDASPAIPPARFYIDIAPLGAFGMLEPWTPGEGPILEPSDDAPMRPRVGARETIAPKGEVTGPEHTLKTPAERLGLTGKPRAKAEKCLADAIYFESRGESERGQMAVAQVVMNRVFSGYYPDDVCGVVYQNAHRRLACQFTFACDGIPDRVTEPDAWSRAKRIARETLDGKHWLPDVGKATHYHATWVHPYWVRAMRKLDKIGVHTFYRPRKWGDGADSPIWGDAVTAKKL
jgi:spore germination cell wall hydrolase CwlJ-like protein